MKPGQYTDAELLEMYAPVLRFSGGENFFPMNVNDFIRGSSYFVKKTERMEKPLYMKVVNFIKDFLHLVRRPGKGEEFLADWNEGIDLKTRLGLLEKNNHKDTYMQFVPDRSKSENVNEVKLFLEVLFLVVVIIAGIIRLHYEVRAAIPLGGFDIAKMLVLGFLICIWPTIDADGKVHLAFLLNLFGIFFFGTIYGFGLTMLALALVVGFAFVYLVFFLGSLGRDYIPEQRIPALNLIGLFFISAGSGIIGFLLGFWIGGAVELSAITAISAFIFYMLLMIGKKMEDKAAEERVTKKVKAIRLLPWMIFFVIALPWLVFQIQWFDIGFALAFAISLAGVSLLWYALDSFSPIKPGLLLEENERKKVLGWDLRVLMIIALVLLLNAVVSYFISSFDTRYVGNFITASILHFSFSIMNLVLTIGLLGTRVISYFLDLFSELDRTDVAKAKQKYDKLVSGRKAMTDPDQNKLYWYYGRVCHEGNWTILQYNYFYAFNDFRTTAGGMNDHEGDWECVTVYVRQDAGDETCECNDKPHTVPFGVAYSQHYQGEFRFWEDVKKVKDIGDRETCHPLVFAALGSHANYPTPDVYDLSAQFSGITQRFVTALEKFIKQFRTSSRLVDKYIREIENVANQYDDSDNGKIARGGRLDVGSREFAAGDGLRIGYKTPATDYDKENKVALQLPETIYHRESNFDGKPATPSNIFEDWAYEIINDDKPEWVKYKGMWGRNTNVEGENGPQGPKWDAKGEFRVRWGKSENTKEKNLNKRYHLEWMDVLLLDIVRNDNKPTYLRKKALRQITSGPVQE